MRCGCCCTLSDGVKCRLRKSEITGNARGPHPNVIKIKAIAQRGGTHENAHIGNGVRVLANKGMKRGQTMYCGGEIGLICVFSAVL